MKSFISNFKLHQPNNLISQKGCVDWLIKYHGEEFRPDFEKYAVKPDYIQSRMVYAPGVSDIPAVPMALYAIDEEKKPDMAYRGKVAQFMAEQVFADLYQDESVAPDHINHVSCTHYQSPSAPQKMVVGKEWFADTKVTHLYHMGCYAALPAVRVSKAYVADGAKRVDVVHTEFCSFHLDKDNTTAEQIIMKTLFSDGGIRYSVVNEDEFNSHQQSGYEILSHHEMVVPGTDKEMSWLVGSHGFVMTLTKNVPIFLAKKIEAYMVDMFAKAGLDYHELKEDTLFAVHPGGPKIIELVERMLKLKPEQVQHSKDILHMRGNMSSATIPHIWEHMLSDETVEDKQYVASVAFGPGLTMTGAMLKICK
jgi:predicted naringenin-chalcone synthase